MSKFFHQWLVNGLQDDTLSEGRMKFCSIGDDEEDGLDLTGGGAGHPSESDEHFRFESHEEAERGYQELQSMWNRNQERLADMERRYGSLEQELQGMRQEQQGPGRMGDQRMDPLDGESEELANRVVDELRKRNLKQDDPKYVNQYLTVLAKEMLKQTRKYDGQAIEQVRSQISRQDQERNNFEESKAFTNRLLSEQFGFKGEELSSAFERVVDATFNKQRRDPDWFNRVSPDKQIQELVKECSRDYRWGNNSNGDQTQNNNSLGTDEGQSQSSFNREDLRREQRRRTSAMTGGMEGGSRVMNRGTGKGEAPPDNPGSMLRDLKNFKSSRRDLAGEKRRFAER